MLQQQRVESEDKSKRKKKMIRGHHRRRSSTPSVDFGVDDEEEEESEAQMKCVSCKEDYGSSDAGTCRECYEEASETEEELKREIEDLKAKVNFLRFWSPSQHLHQQQRTTPFFSDIVLVASHDESGKSTPYPVPVPANRALLVSTHFDSTIFL